MKLSERIEKNYADIPSVGSLIDWGKDARLLEAKNERLQAENDRLVDANRRIKAALRKHKEPFSVRCHQIDEILHEP